MVRPKTRKEIAAIPQVDNSIYDNLKTPKIVKYNRDQKQPISKGLISKFKPKNDSNSEAVTGMDTLPLLRTNCKVKPKCEMAIEDMKTKTRVKAYPEKTYAEKSYAEKTYAEKSFADKTYADKSYADKLYADKLYTEKEDCKEQETDEFFHLVSMCVQNSVKRAVRDTYEKMIKPLNNKIDEMTEQMGHQEAKMKKMQDDLASKISHYGEEGARHFRYLCMKSEYDKMFYQHQSSLTFHPCDCSCDDLLSTKLHPKYSCPQKLPNCSNRHSHNILASTRSSIGQVHRQNHSLHMEPSSATDRPLSQKPSCQRKRKPNNPPPTPNGQTQQTPQPCNAGSSLLIPEDTNEAISYLLDKVCPNFFVKDSDKDCKDSDELPVEDYRLNIIPSENDIAERLYTNDDDSEESSDKD